MPDEYAATNVLIASRRCSDAAITERAGGFRLLQEDLLVDRRLVGRQLLVNRQRACLIAKRARLARVLGSSCHLFKLAPVPQRSA